MQALLASPRQSLTEAQVLSAISNPSPAVRHGVDVLDSTLAVKPDESLPVDWDTGGEVSWDYRPSDPAAGATEATEVRRSARLTLAGDVDDDLLLSRLFRIWTEMRATDGTWVRFHLGTFTSTLPPREDDGQVVRRSLTLAPREHLFASRTLTDAVTVTATEDVIAHVKSDLSTVFGITSTAFTQPDDATLGQDYFFPAGISFAAKWRRMLAGITFDQVTTTVGGRPTSQSLTTLAGKGPEWTYEPGGGRIVVPGRVEALDPELPNRLVFEARNGPSLGGTVGNGLYIVVNQSEGPASIDRRGFVVNRTVQVDAANQVELEAYGKAEARMLFAGGGLRAQVQVGLNPLFDDRDVTRLIRPRLGLTGDWNVTSWRYPLRRITGPDAVLMPLTCEFRTTPTVEAA